VKTVLAKEALTEVAASAVLGPGASAQALARVRSAAAAAAGKLGQDIVAFDVSGRLSVTDVFLIVTGAVGRQAAAIVDAVEERLRSEGAKPIACEGAQQSRWTLLDFGDLVVHVQLPEVRTLFALERLWGDCPRIDLELPAPAAAVDG
jgi:ribosome-associated protein